MTNNNNNNNISRVVFLLIPFFLGNFGSIKCRNSEEHPLKKKCDAPVVTEGDTGVMTFFLRDSIDLDSDKLFVSLKRAMKPEEVLVACATASPIECTSANVRYQSSARILDHKLTLQIPNITTAFEDVYVLHVYVNDALEPADTCYLTVYKKNSTRSCSAPTVKEGDTGVMTFFFHETLVSSSNHLTAKLAKDGGRGYYDKTLLPAEQIGICISLHIICMVPIDFNNGHLHYISLTAYTNTNISRQIE